MLTTLIVLFGAIMVVTVLPQLVLPFFRGFVPTIPEPPEPATSVIHLFGGPTDGAVHKVRGDSDDLPHFFVHPYLPKDEHGNPEPPEENIVSNQSGMVFVRPSLAYYQQITETDYFYMRDISDAEFQKIRMTGELPKPEAK